jgi:hypothetical protein
MRLRDARQEDLETVRQMTRAGSRCPDLVGDRVVYAKVVVDDNDQIMAVGVAEKAVEVSLVVNPKLHPAVKLVAIRALNDLLPQLRSLGYDFAIAFIPPEIDAPFSRRLRALGWLRMWTARWISLG